MLPACDPHHSLTEHGAGKALLLRPPEPALRAQSPALCDSCSLTLPRNQGWAAPIVLAPSLATGLLHHFSELPSRC